MLFRLESKSKRFNLRCKGPENVLKKNKQTKKRNKDIFFGPVGYTDPPRSCWINWEENCVSESPPHIFSLKKLEYKYSKGHGDMHEGTEMSKVSWVGTVMN